ncbi:filamentous haemagglutinin family protein [Dyella silvatica]|uniref:filamentous haemagglutinin family protein n=1 Tax=Dyella silvatica TaxID=2992128 RepID=UPI00224F5779|nr:filamentous haemagglutinin family protein [Dyella silvatica]
MIKPVRFGGDSGATINRRPLAQWIAAALAMGAMQAHAGNPAQLSQAWLAQQQQIGVQAAQSGAPSALPPGLTPQTSGQLLQQRVVQQSIANLNNAAQAVAAQISAQQAAQQAAQQLSSTIPNGLTVGGLQVAAAAANNPSLWQNANQPTQSVANGQSTVQIKQTDQKAILTWDSFNVGRNTTVYFNQSGGTQSDGSNNWVALNRIQDPSGSPSQIFGQIKAEGSVYLLNRNGILFGAGSQVNTHSLLASSLNFFSSDVGISNSNFLKGGIGSQAAVSGFLTDGAFTDGRNHDVVIQKGASITTGPQGFALIAAPNVSNAGSIVADDGQAILAAGIQFNNLAGTINGGGLNVLNAQGPFDAQNYPVGGLASNSGLIQSRRGQVHMLGFNVDQSGVALASTSISHPGSIELNARDDGNAANNYVRHGALNLNAGSVTAVLPEKDGTTTSSTPAANSAFTTGNLTLAGGTVSFNAGSLLEAPGAALSITAQLNGNLTDGPTAGRIYVDGGSILDVSGLTNVSLPMSALLVSISRIGQNELADSPLLRNSFLYTQKNVVIDSTQSGTRSDGLNWVGSPILNVGGYVQNVPRDISQMLTKGGSISLDGVEVIVRNGAQLNLDGGYLAYQAGWVDTPNLLGANGRIYNIANADPQMSYVGFAGQYSVSHNRWGITENYSNPLLAGAVRWDPGFVVGSDAGSLKIATSRALVLDGDISAQAFAGRNQVANGNQPAAGSFSLVAQPRSSGASDVLLQQATLSLSDRDPAFNAATPWSAVPNTPSGNTDDLQFWLPLSANTIQQAGFGTVNIATSPDSGGQIVQQAGTTLAVHPGGSINLSANRISIFGNLAAPAGSISLTSIGPAASNMPGLQDANGQPLRADITIGSGATLGARGQWVNDSGRTADNMVGNRYINGGSISLTTQQGAQTGSQSSVDGTGSIILQSGSLLDVSGGGYVGTNSQVALNHGVPTGSGGDINLITYSAQGATKFGLTQNAPNDLSSGSIQLGGQLRAYGFSGGGTLTMQAAQLQIGGKPGNLAMANGLYLDPGFFAGQGFDGYALTAITDANIAAGSQVKVSRSNLLPNYQALLTAPSGTDLYAANAAGSSLNYVSVGQLDAYHRYISASQSAGHGPGFSLNAGVYLDWNQQFGIPNSGSPQYAGVSGSLLLAPGAAILADAGATVSLAGTQNTIVQGTVSAPGGHINIATQKLTNRAGLQAVTPQVWLGAQSVLDASGVALLNPWAAAVVQGGTTGMGLSGAVTPRSGIVLAGGAVSLTGNASYVVAEQGSQINVSGAAATFDLPTAGSSVLGQSVSYIATPVWSDAGSITMAAAAGLYADATLTAQGGAAQAEGGTLNIIGMAVPLGRQAKASGILLQSSGSLLAAGLRPGSAIEAGAPSGLLHFAVDRLTNSGITSLNLGPDVSSASLGNQVAVPIGFAGNINLQLGRSFIANAPSYLALPQGSSGLGATAAGYATGNGTVSITAPYVNLSSNTLLSATPVARAGDGVLQINANAIDLGGVVNLQQWANASFNSGGDIRFYLPALYAYQQGANVPGLLFSTGNLSFKAAQLYPASDYHFVIDANASGIADASGQARTTTVSILPNGASSTPLSAGGALLISANRIEQQGTIRVPSGNLVLGVSDPLAGATGFGLDPAKFPLAVTDSVHLAKGSVTSVSLDGATLPYGTTIDGVEWRYNGDPNASSPDLTAPPAKQLSLNGNHLSLDAGAGVDLSGGGHLQAAEWTAGTGGSRDVLAQYSTSYATSTSGTQVPQYSDGRAIYAIIPGYSSAMGAHDAALEKGAGAGPAVGQSVYLSGAAGLPAGYYTLLPARYATLPGAYRVVQDTSAVDSVLGRAATLPDGSLNISGYFADALSGARQARNTSFLLQSAPVWQQYSQYRLSDADTFFGAQASKAGIVAPYMPADAGRLVLAASQSLDLGATLTAAAATGGRSSQVDIAAQAIQILGTQQTANAGYLGLSADGLTALGSGSLLIGGTRSLNSSGYTINSIADSVLLSNDSNHALAGPEILLVANGSGHAGAQGVVLAGGSYIQARGNGNGAGSLPLSFGSDASKDANGNLIAAVSGNGALLRVSQNGTAAVLRHAVSNPAGGQLLIGAGARVDGGSALTLDATGNTQVDASAALSGNAIDANSNHITFTSSNSNVVSDGLVIGPNTLNLLRGAQQVTLRSRGSIDFLGNVNIDLANSLNLNAGAFTSDGGQVSIAASTLGLGNALGAVVPGFVAGAGQLSLHAGELDFSAGNSTLRGFGQVTATASQGIVGQGSGGMDFGNLGVTLVAPVLMADSGANTSLTTTGAMNLQNAGGQALLRSSLGGALSLSGGSVSVGTSLAASAGNLSLRATSGDLELASGSQLSTAGVNKTFQDVTTYAAGGNLSLTADQGSVNIRPGSAIGFAGAAQGGDAGSLTISAKGNVLLGGRLDGHALSGYRSGYFTLNSGNAVDLNSIAGIAQGAGITGMIQVASGAGDLSLAAGNTLRAQKVFLTATAVDASQGHVLIAGRIDASADAGSHIELYGRNGVDVEGSLIATSGIPAQRGGDVVLGTGGTSDGSLNTAYGYQNVQAANAGYIHLGSNAHIDVSGGSSDASGGSVSLRAPLLSNGDVPITIDGGNQTIVGARVVTVEPYAVWSTADKQTDLSKYFDGLIDPSGWYKYDANGKPTLVAGTWVDATGKILAAPADDATLQSYLTNNYFIPGAAANTDHQSFYGYIGADPSKGAGTLMSYIQQPGFSFGNRYTGISNVQVRPGIELDNPAAGPQQGTISLLTNWNLGAGTTQKDGSIALAYRYQGMAPILTVRAAGDLDIKASLTDGFYQQNNGAVLADPPAPPPPPVSDNGYATAVAAYTKSLNYMDANGIWNGTINLKAGSAAQGLTPGGGKVSITADPYYQPLQAPLKKQSVNYYINYEAYIGDVGDDVTGTWAAVFATRDAKGFLAYKPTPLVAPQPASYANYADYVNAYYDPTPGNTSWLSSNFRTNPVANRLHTPSPLLAPADTDYSQYSSDYAIYIAGHTAYYTYVSRNVGNTSFGSQLFYAPFAPAANAASDPGGGKPPSIPVPGAAANNSPSNMPSLGNPASLASATLLGGSSSSYRLIAGAQLDSTNPLSVAGTGVGNVNLDGHFAVVDTLTNANAGGGKDLYPGKTLLFPTTVRTGTGSIDIASSNDISWLDSTAPAVIYTAGAPASGTTANTNVSVLRPSQVSMAPATVPDMLVSGQVNPDHGGDVSLNAHGSINAIEQVIDVDGSVTGVKGTSIAQFWWPWMQTGNSADGSASSINFANFAQGIMSLGGNVAITAGQDIHQLSVSLPTTWYAQANGSSVTTVGGGNLDVQAGRDILSGSYFVAKGQGSLFAGGRIGAELSYTVPRTVYAFGSISTPVSTLLAAQDTQWHVSALQGVDIGGVFNPSYAALNGQVSALLPAGHFDAQSFSSASALSVSTAVGDITFDSLSVPGYWFGYGSSTGMGNPGSILPANLNLTALSGNINLLGAGSLYPSVNGNLSLLANGAIGFSEQVYTMGNPTFGGSVGSYNFGLIDAPAAFLPSPLQPYGGLSSSDYLAQMTFGYINVDGTNPIPTLLHQPAPLHGGDSTPVRIYALQGDISDGLIAPGGFQYRSLVISPAKPALLYAGRDIVNLSFAGQHTHDADITRIVAGRDIYDTAINRNFAPPLNDPGAYMLAPSLLLGGPGSLQVEAGRNIGPLTSQADIATNHTITGSNATGIDSIGNALNPYLPHKSADIGVLFGVKPGIATADFIARYVDDPAGVEGVGSLLPDLVDFMNQRLAGQVVDTGYAKDQQQVQLSAAQARALFAAQPDYVQRMFVQQELFKILAIVGADYNKLGSPYYQQYARGYAALGTLFPASLGYTANGSGQGGINGAAKTVDTGDLDIRSSTIQTQQGGNISILGPGGQALLGSASAPPVITDDQGNVLAGPNSMGVLTLEQGHVNMFTDRSVLLAQSRIFTEQGGDLVIWSSNGDINAGQGAKTTAEIPPPTYLCTVDAWCRIDARGQVSGAGIATLQSVPGAAVGSVYLVAPRGTVDAGDAGIRVSGNLVVAAAQVANADNIQVQGEKIGVPVVQSVNVSALSAASAAASAINQAADDMSRKQQDDARSKQPSIISVQVLGFGDKTSSVESRPSGADYDPHSPIQVLGAGRLSDAKRQVLTAAERQRLAE